MPAMALMITAADMHVASTAKACCSRGPLMRRANALTSNIATTAPDVNGTEIDQFIPLLIPAVNAPAIETNAITASDVETTDYEARLVAARREGTMMKPPPTPRSPDKKPVAIPEIASEPAPEPVHMRRPVTLSR